MQRTIKVSYIVTTKNRAHFFSKTLDNIRQFITKKDELIVMDGGSTDDTLKLIKKNKDIITYWVSEPDHGEAHALNKGILMSRGKYIKILTDDDYIYPKAMRQAIKILEKHPEIDAVQCGGESYFTNEATGEPQLQYYPQVFPGVEIAHDLLHVITYCPCGLGLILTRKVIARAGLFDTNFRAVDMSYISKLILCGANFKYLNINLYRHTQYGHSGQKMVDEIHRDEARVFLDHGLWEQTMKVETPVLEKVLGLDKTNHGRQLLRSIKLLDVLRRKNITFPIDILSWIAKQKKSWTKVKESIKKKTVSLTPYVPQPPVRDGKMW